MFNLSRPRSGANRIRLSVLGLTLLTPLFALSCGSEMSSRLNSDDAVGDAEGMDRIVVPPKAYYDALMSERMQLAGSGALARSSTQVLYVNFSGATVKRGYGKGQSFIPCKDTTEIPSSGLSIQDQEIVLNKAAQYFSNAAVSIKITPEQPKSGDFTTMHVGGRYSSLGCLGGASVAGVAPYDVSNANPNDIGFVFMGRGDLEMIAQTLAHEAGHSFGLDHTNNRIDIMYPVTSGDLEGFAKGSSPRGRLQDGPLMLQTALGTGFASVSGNFVPATRPTPTDPTPSPSPPNNNQTPDLADLLANLPGLGSLNGLSSILNSLPGSVLSNLTCIIPNVNSNASQGGLPLPNANGALGVLTLLQNASMAQNRGQLNMANVLNLASSLQSMNITQLLTLAGISLGGNQCPKQLTPVNIPGITSTSPNQSPGSLDLAKLLGLGQINNPGSLIALLPQYAQLIGTSSQGGNSQILMSIVMMAFTQQYNGLPSSQTSP
jgi:hypothetical protein